MKITKSKLRQIIKESLEDENNEIKAKLFTLYFNPVTREQAIEIGNSLGMSVDSNFFYDVDLTGYDLRYNNLSLRNANLKGVNLSNTNMSGS